ncbi:Aldo/keto reductase family protein [Prochlorococcus marinus str. MIT 1342]|uniref:aldo/keto reductase n=1 Tax=Prochlorococcus TaxID=1218 RepID=UPI0007B3EADE|nr:aldo/keto reductase [Prochlorococcus marinus]KZR79937.1 Aldo/keto reductase family protein [Prochlorococcus marinus str. MIT 1342]
MNICLGIYAISKYHNDLSGYGVVTKAEALDILFTSLQRNITLIDTAPGYGNGRASTLLKLCADNGYNFQVNTKVGLDIDTGKFSTDLITYHLEHIAKTKPIDYKTIFLHNPPSQLLNDLNFLEHFSSVVRDYLGSQIKVGISLGSPNDIINIHPCFHFQAIQCNLSWIDLRLLEYASSLESLEVYPRSIFGSGLIPILLSQLNSSDEFDLSSINFPVNDIRSNWDLDNLLLRLSPDIDRLKRISRFLKSTDPSIIATSLYEHLPFSTIPIIGCMNTQELVQTVSAFKLSHSRDLKKFLV